MVAAIDRNDASRHDSLFQDRQHELEQTADSMPRPVSPEFPYLMEKNTGVVHPYVPTLAARGDLVIGCYTLSGSRNPADKDPNYDPQSVYSRQEMLDRVNAQPARTMADQRAELAEREANLEREIQRRVDEKLKAAQDVEVAPAAPAKPKTKRAAAKPAAKVEPTPDDKLVGNQPEIAENSQEPLSPAPVTQELESLDAVADALLGANPSN